MQPVRLSHSSISSFLRCPRRWYLSYVAELAPVAEKSRPLEFGTAFHEALEIWWTNDLPEAARLEMAIEAFTRSSTGLSFEDRILGPVLLRGYAAMYGGDELRFQGIPIAERKIELPVLDLDGKPDPRMVLVAVMDVVGYTPEGETVIVEHKTTASDIRSANFWDRFRDSLQAKLYWIAATDLGRAPSSAIFDVVRAPVMHRRLATPIASREFYKRATGDARVGDPKPGTRLVDETREEFAARVEQTLLADPSAFYARQPYPYDATQIQMARVDLYEVGCMMVDMVQRESGGPRNPDGCKAYNSVCGFHAACYGSADLNDTTLYQVRTR